MLKITLYSLLCLFSLPAAAQDLQADNMLLFQRKSGGWSKQFNGKAFKYDVIFSTEEKQLIAIAAAKDDANIDNNSTAKEIKHLLKTYTQIKNSAYLTAAENGIRYLLKMQYTNGGFPQYYPDSSLYRSQITYNDNAMINALEILQDVSLKQNGFEIVDPSLVEPSTVAVRNGIKCILNTQIKVNGQLTAWCQQYDKTTLLPAKARSYELASISGQETVGIISFLMQQPNPSRQIQDAINAGMAWLSSVKIDGYSFLPVPAPGTEKGTDKKIIAAPGSTIWARYYEIDSNKPFFCDRDGIKKYDVTEISYGARNGYSWYGPWAKNLFEKEYPKWLKKNPIK